VGSSGRIYLYVPSCAFYRAEQWGVIRPRPIAHLGTQAHIYTGHMGESYLAFHALVTAWQGRSYFRITVTSAFDNIKSRTLDSMAIALARAAVRKACPA